MSNEILVSKLADVHPDAMVSGALIRDYAHISSEANIGEDTSIGLHTFIGANVLIGPRVMIEGKCLIKEDAIICPNDVVSKSSNARQIDSGTIVGPGVYLHDEVELASEAIIPTQGTIVSIGVFGTKHRVVTIYGNDEYPRYSIGCQKGVDFRTFKDRVKDNLQTTPESASTYRPFVESCRQLGYVVQKAYHRETKLIEELRAEHEELFGFLR
jgi:carbonic anhydrase/acetyltransferase-like protein (isoleucine patch superfamily)